jgi:hypothetical protein
MSHLNLTLDEYKTIIENLNRQNKNLDNLNKNLDALNKQHYNLYMETQLKFERLQDELLIFHAEVRGHKINWEDMFYSEPDIGCDYKNEFQTQGKNQNLGKERKKRSHSI